MRVLIRVDNAGVHRVYLCLKTTAGGFCRGGGLTTRARMLSLAQKIARS